MEAFGIKSGSAFYRGLQMSYYDSQPRSREIPPPIGSAPEGHDYVHPWIISAVVSTIAFTIGFVFLYFTGAWKQIQQWADAPFLFYLAILLPVIAGFTVYGIVLFTLRILGKGKQHGSRWV